MWPTAVKPEAIAAAVGGRRDVGIDSTWAIDHPSLSWYDCENRPEADGRRRQRGNVTKG